MTFKRANPLTSEDGVPIDFTYLLCFNEGMAKLGSDDLKAIKALIEVTIDEKELVTKSDLSHLPNKDEFYEQTGEILKRLDDVEIEKDVLAHQVSEHEDRLEKIDSKLGLTSN